MLVTLVTGEATHSQILLFVPSDPSLTPHFVVRAAVARQTKQRFIGQRRQVLCSVRHGSVKQLKPHERGRLNGAHTALLTAPMSH